MWAAITGAAGAIVAALIALGGVVVGQRRGSRYERSHWERDQLLDAVSMFVALTGDRYEAARNSPVPIRTRGDAGVREAAARARITVLGDDDVHQRLEALASAVGPITERSTQAELDRAIDALRAFIAAARRQLALPDRQSTAGTQL